MDALRARYSGLIWAEELALSSGARRCDFWTLHPHASKGYRATAYEVKVSRADFKRETYKKQREARLFSDEFYYVTPPGLLSPDEIPDWAGLMEYNIEAGTWRTPSSAPRRDKDAPSWELVVSIMRFSGEVRRDTDLIRMENARLEESLKRANDQIIRMMRDQRIAP